jgi:hypothetical protein
METWKGLIIGIKGCEMPLQTLQFCGLHTWRPDVRQMAVYAIPCAELSAVLWGRSEGQILEYGNVPLRR